MSHVSDEIEGNVTTLLEVMDVTFNVVYVGEGADQPDPVKGTDRYELNSKPQPWKHDLWQFTLSSPKRDGDPHSRPAASMSETFKTGLGHRVKPKGFVSGWHHGYVRPGTLAAEQNMKLMTPVKPTAASVLYSILLDGEAQHQSFRDWAGDFGYDADSINAFTTYQACCKIGESLSKIFTREQRASLQEALQEY